jgi:hypothetical protein
MSGVDTSILQNDMSSGEMLMMGVQSGNGMAGIKYQKSHRNQKFVRRYSHDRSERSGVRLKVIQMHSM